MERATFSVLFYVKRTKRLKDGSYPIYARLTVNGERAEFGIQKSLRIKEWNSQSGYAKGQSKQAKDLNNYIDFIKGRLVA